MKKLNLLFSFLILLLTSMLFQSCTAQAHLKLKDDGKVEIKFQGSAGVAFTKMIQAATGNDQIIFETDEITTELLKSGFKNVTAKSNKTDLTVSMTDANKSSFLFTSGIIQADGKKLHAKISRKTLANFYDQADDQIKMILDLLLAPVFNDEEMTEAEYVETLSSFYGAGIGKELSTSAIEIILESPDGTKTKKSIPLSFLLCLNEEISL